METDKKTKEIEEVKKNKIRITLTCRNLKSVEKGFNIFYSLLRNCFKS